MSAYIDYPQLLKGSRDGAAYVHVPPTWGEVWRVARRASKDRLVRIGVIGDSTAAGIYTDNHDNGWVGLIRRTLQSRYGDGGSGWLDWPNSLVGGFGGPGGPNGGDTTETGAWTDVLGGVNGLSRRPSVDGNGATLTFHPRGTTLDFVSRVDPLFGRYDRQIDGGSVVQVPQNLTAAVSIVNVPVAAGSHDVVLTAAAGQCRIHGVRGRNATGVMVDNFGKGGRSISATGGVAAPLNAAAEGLAGQTTLSTSFDVLTPLDLVIVCLGVNDATDSVTTNYDTMWETLNELQLEIRDNGFNSTTPPEVIVVIQHVCEFADAATPYKYGRIASTMRDWGVSAGAAVVDIWALGRYSGQFGNKLGWFQLGANDVHPSVIGNKAYANPVIELLTVV